MGFQSGLSGLNASAKNLDVIGNNVANANTVGFKASRAVFADVFASSLAGAGASNIGIGTKVAQVQQEFLRHLQAHGVGAAFHYVPLHSSAAGRRYGRVVTEPQHAVRFAERLVRLPLWPAMTDDEVDRVITAVRAFGPLTPAAPAAPAALAATTSTGQDSIWA